MHRPAGGHRRAAIESVSPPRLTAAQHGVFVGLGGEEAPDGGFQRRHDLAGRGTTSRESLDAAVEEPAEVAKLLGVAGVVVGGAGEGVGPTIGPCGDSPSSSALTSTQK